MQLKEYRNQSFLNVNADDFINFSSPEHVYLLGLIWADGYISSNTKRKFIRIELCAPDMDNLTSIFEATGKWGFCRRQRANRQEQVSAECNNAKLVDFLFEHNYDTKSVSSPTIMNVIPEHLQKYFLRGWSDGDGCFYSRDRTSQFTVAGSYNQDWSLIEKYFNDRDIRCKASSKISKLGHGCSYVRLSNQIDIIKLGNILYENTYDGIGLERKFSKYLEIKAKPPRYSFKVQV